MLETLEKTLPRASYLDEAVFQREYQAIFSSGWVCVGRSEQLASAGDYLAFKLGQDSVLVVRGERGDLRAFYNVCRHRGSELVPMPDSTPQSGRFKRTITCPYHAWSYQLNGSLKNAPHLNLPSSDIELHRVSISTWAGFIFLRTDNRRDETLESALGSGAERISRYPLEDLRVGQSIDYSVNANWKVLLENYNECYHCGPVHPELCKIVPAFRDKGGSDVDWEVGVPHREGAYTFTEDGTTTRQAFPGLSDTEKTHHKGELFYPNLMISLSMDHVAAFYVWPESASKTRIRCDFLFHPDEMLRSNFDPSDAVEFWDKVNRQDWSICESVQRGMNNRVFEHGYYAAMEDYSLDLRRYVSNRLSSHDE